MDLELLALPYVGANGRTVLVLVVETPWSHLSRHEDEVAVPEISSFQGGAET